MPNYYEELVKKYGRKRRVDRIEVRVISPNESYQTRSSWNKGIPHSEAAKKKIRLSCLKSGVGTWNKNRKKSEEWAEKISQSKIKYFKLTRLGIKDFLVLRDQREDKPDSNSKI